MSDICIHWFVLGVSSDMTGIERLVVGHAHEFLSRPSTPAVALVVHVDEDARWPEALPADSRIRIVRHARVLGRLVRAPRRRAATGAALVHSFSGVPPRTSVPCFYTVYDWGPYTDRALGLRARLLWALAIWRGIRRGAEIFAYSSEVLERPPWVVRRMVARRRSTLLAIPAPLEPSKGDAPGDPGGFLLFVGTDSPRKRLALLTAAAEQARTPLVLAGDGTERYHGDFVTGLGRVDEPTLLKLYAGCRAVVLVSSYEGYGLPVAEAAAYGVRSVVSPEVAAVHQAERPDALIPVPCESVASLAAALDALPPGRLAFRGPDHRSEPGVSLTDAYGNGPRRGSGGRRGPGQDVP